MIAKIKYGYIDFIVNRLRERCDQLKVLEDIMLRCSKDTGQLILLMKSGRLIVESSDEEGVFHILKGVLE